MTSGDGWSATNGRQAERPLISAEQIAAELGLPRPTEEQRAVIEAGPDPALVVAGAGSGKTETMANRVLWLLANGLVERGEVLGLTFTRKAAKELDERIRRRIAQLERAKLMPSRADGRPADVLETPQVSTYNAFANTLYRDHALLVGREPDGALLGEAAAWQLARSVVVRSGDPRLAELDRTPDALTDAVLRLSRAMNEHLVDPARLSDLAARFGRLPDLPSGSRGAFAEVDELAAAISSLELLLGLVDEYEARKLERGAIEFSDQVALALRILGSRPSVREQLRARHRVVLLDEYQDTSVSQSRMLSLLFAEHPVMAVGDPNQSIYGWRGASAANLEQFARDFGGEHGAARFALSTSWRNGRRVLDAANALAAPLNTRMRVTVAELTASPVASQHPVDSVFPETIVEEAGQVAEWLAARLAEPDADGRPPSAALLLRSRSTQHRFLGALRERGVPFHVLGIGGLLSEPEIADLVSALRVVHDPHAGLELVRLLAGARWRIGVRDIWALRRYASVLRDRDLRGGRLEAPVREAVRASVAGDDSGSIVDALDALAHARSGHPDLAAFSDTGIERLRSAGRFFAALRARAGLDLSDLVAVIEGELRLDIESAANPARRDAAAPRQAFADALSSYLTVAPSQDLGGFLSWLRQAEQREDLSPRPEPPEPGTVQVLTIHSAKGLEWDHVTVPRLVEGELPGRPRDGYQAWLRFGELPWPLRGDADELPRFAWEAASTRKELVDARGRFVEEVEAHRRAEERRLAYVAVTRARHRVLLSGSFWSGQRKPRRPSEFLRDLAEAGLVAALPEATMLEESPLGDEVDEIRWPRDPLGTRRVLVEAAASAVRDAEPELRGPWAEQARLLLADRADRDHGSLGAPPSRIAASRFKDFVADPAAIAERLRRPLPERPFRETRLGTLFHAWVEHRYGVAGAVERIDAELAEIDGAESGDLDAAGFDPAGFDPTGFDPTGVDSVRLDELQRSFERSEWAGLEPLEVEREIHLPFAGHIVVCKIDAVFRCGDRIEIVDWKTGRAPKDAADLERRKLQLALYRLAYASWAGVDPARVDAVFYFVADDLVIRPDRLHETSELERLWRERVVPVLGVPG